LVWLSLIDLEFGFHGSKEIKGRWSKIVRKKKKYMEKG